MRVKTLLKHYDGNFYIYEDVMDKSGHFMEINKCLADHNTYDAVKRQIKNRKVYLFQTSDSCIDIYLR